MRRLLRLFCRHRSLVWTSIRNVKWRDKDGTERTGKLVNAECERCRKVWAMSREKG